MPDTTNLISELLRRGWSPVERNMRNHYPPGHPQGSARWYGKVSECIPCLTLYENQETCQRCSDPLVAAFCDCGEPATVIVEDRPVNAAFALCYNCSRYGRKTSG